MTTRYVNAEGAIVRRPDAVRDDQGRWVLLAYADDALLAEHGYYVLTTEPVPDGYIATDWTITVGKDSATRTPTLAPAPEPPPPPRDLAADLDALTAAVVAKTVVTREDLEVAKLSLTDAETVEATKEKS
jgi:hypothetical protein